MADEPKTPTLPASNKTQRYIFKYKPVDTSKTVTEADLLKDKDFMIASRVVYHALKRRDPEEIKQMQDPVAQADWGITHMRWEANNFAVAGYDLAINRKYWTTEQKEAYQYMKEAFENKEATGAGFAKALSYALLDPVNLISLGTYSLLFKGLSRASKLQGLAKFANKAITQDVVLGAGFGGARSYIHQSVEIEADVRKDLSYKSLLAESAVGAGVTAGLGTALRALGNKLSGSKAATVASRDVKVVERNNIMNKQTAAEIIEELGSIVREPTRDTRAGGRDRITNSMIKKSVATYHSLAPFQKSQVTHLTRRVLYEDMEIAPIDIGAIVEKTTDIVEGSSLVAHALDILPLSELEDATAQLAGNYSSITSLYILQTTPEIETNTISAGLVTYSRYLDSRLAQVENNITISSDTTEINSLLDIWAGLNTRKGVIDGFIEERGVLKGRLFESLDNTASRAIIQKAKDKEALGIINRVLDKNITAEATNRETLSGAELRAVVNQLEKDAKKAWELGAFDKFAEFIVEQDLVRSLDNAPLNTVAGNVANGLYEMTVGFIFSAKSVLTNTIVPAFIIPTRPLLKAFTSNLPFRARVQQLSTTYKTMLDQIPIAFRSAWQAFKHESTFINRGGLAPEFSISGRTGGVLRLLPRLVTASDEFMSRQAIASYLVNEKVGQALDIAVHQGITDTKEFKRIANEAMVDYLYNLQLAKGRLYKNIQPIVRKGKDLGLTGEALAEYVEKNVVAATTVLENEAPNSLLVSQTSMDKEASLFSLISTMQQDLDSDFGNALSQLGNNSYFKLITGAYFVKNPLIMLKSIARQTPAVRFFVGGLQQDLSGINGTAKQEMAMGAAVMGYGLMMIAMKSYMEDKIKGTGNFRNKEQRRVDSLAGEAGGFTYTTDNGTSIELNRLAPAGFIVGIYAELFDAISNIELRKKQGEDVGTLEESINTALLVAAKIVNETPGLQHTGQIATILESLERGEDINGGSDLFYKYLSTITAPSVLKDLVNASDSDQFVRQQANVQQAIYNRILKNTWGSWRDALDKAINNNITEIKTAKIYDALGNEMQEIKTSAFNVLNSKTEIERQRNYSKDELFIFNKLAEMQRKTNVAFKPPVKHELFGDEDLRTILTADNTKTMYDAYHDELRNLPQFKKTLLRILKKDRLNIGKEGEFGVHTLAIQSLINDAYDIAIRKATVKHNKELAKKSLRAKADEQKRVLKGDAEVEL